ncbi:hypothetical protein ACFXGA_00480 [Actinosynnema sp. NPDC059335]|uniref:hypothetical protein n=1 Tax=Actinosynnema sp. NPDC059335 TaxID=3346804 RepID=UPI00366D090D
MGDYLTGDRYHAHRDREVRREWTAEEHRLRARQLLWEAYSTTHHDTVMRELAAAQVHATLAVSLAGDNVGPHTHGPVR